MCVYFVYCTIYYDTRGRATGEALLVRRSHIDPYSVLRPRYTNTRIHEYTIHEYTNTRIHEYTNTRIHEYTIHDMNTR